MVNTKTKKSKAGAPKKSKEERKNPNTGLTGEMMTWRRQEADNRGVSEADIMREAFSMYMTAVESQRGDATVQELFKDVYDKSISGKK